MFGDLSLVANVADAFAQRVQDAWLARSGTSFSIVLSGGDTARRCYERLAMQSAPTLDWATVDVFWGDERCVPADDAASNARLAREALLDAVGPVRSVHPMRCDEGADAYDAVLRAAAPFDVVHLGLGPDAHTASLFPHSDALDAPDDRFVVMNVDPSGANVHRRMTMTFSAIAHARLALVTVEGSTKRDALRAVLAGQDVPAARVRAARVEWLVDAAAGA